MMSSVVNLFLFSLVSTDSEFFDRLVIHYLFLLLVLQILCVSRGYRGVHGALKFASIFKIHKLFFVRANDKISIKISKNIGHTGL
jgi:hypothetical protein